METVELIPESPEQERDAQAMIQAGEAWLREHDRPAMPVSWFHGLPSGLRAALDQAAPGAGKGMWNIATWFLTRPGWRRTFPGRRYLFDGSVRSCILKAAPAADGVAS